MVRAAQYQEYKKFDIASVEEPADLKAVAEQMALPNIASKRFIYEQYDSMVGTRNMSITHLRCRRGEY